MLVITPELHPEKRVSFKSLPVGSVFKEDLTNTTFMKILTVESLAYYLQGQQKFNAVELATGKLSYFETLTINPRCIYDTIELAASPSFYKKCVGEQKT